MWLCGTGRFWTHGGPHLVYRKIFTKTWIYNMKAINLLCEIWVHIHVRATGSRNNFLIQYISLAWHEQHLTIFHSYYHGKHFSESKTSRALMGKPKKICRTLPDWRPPPCPSSYAGNPNKCLSKTEWHWTCLLLIRHISSNYETQKTGKGASGPECKTLCIDLPEITESFISEDMKSAHT